MARITEYMVDRYGVEIPADPMALYWQWAEEDPYSPEEEARAARITAPGFPAIAAYGREGPPEAGNCAARPK